jgi:hypothetical protein
MARVYPEAVAGVEMVGDWKWPRGPGAEAIATRRSQPAESHPPGRAVRCLRSPSVHSEPSLAAVILDAGLVLLHASESAVVDVVDARGPVAFRLTAPPL